MTAWNLKELRFCIPASSYSKLGLVSPMLGCWFFYWCCQCPESVSCQGICSATVFSEIEKFSVITPPSVTRYFHATVAIVVVRFSSGCSRSSKNGIPRILPSIAKVPLPGCPPPAADKQTSSFCSFYLGWMWKKNWDWSSAEKSSASALLVSIRRNICTNCHLLLESSVPSSLPAVAAASPYVLYGSGPDWAFGVQAGSSWWQTTMIPFRQVLIISSAVVVTATA